MAEEKSKIEQLRERYPWLDHVVRAGERYTERHGDHYAAAVTYFSVLSLVPLLMIAFAIAGFVLRAQPDLLAELQSSITNWCLLAQILRKAGVPESTRGAAQPG